MNELSLSHTPLRIDTPEKDRAPPGMIKSSAWSQYPEKNHHCTNQLQEQMMLQSVAVPSRYDYKGWLRRAIQHRYAINPNDHLPILFAAQFPDHFAQAMKDRISQRKSYVRDQSISARIIEPLTRRKQQHQGGRQDWRLRKPSSCFHWRKRGLARC